jgi:dnd system-associated protein 4
MRDRVRPPKDLEVVLDQLKADGVFDTKQKGMMFAAAVGYILHRGEANSVQIEHFGEGIRLDYFRSPDDEGFIDALSVAAAGELAVMDPERQSERIELFEKYALLGLKDLKKACYDERPEFPLNGVLALMDRMSRAGTEDLPGLGDLL